MKSFFIYIMTSRSRVVLSTGIITGLEHRICQHKEGRVDGFTKKYGVDRVVYDESFNNPRDAIAREKEIKGWRQNKRNALVETLNPKWGQPFAYVFRPDARSLASLGMTALRMK
jgi:putative endonuclease